MGHTYVMSDIHGMAELLEKNGVCDADAILELCDSNTYDETYEMLGQLSDNEDRVYRLEGYLFPDTYEFYVNEDPETALQKLIRNCNQKLTKNIRQEAEPSGLYFYCRTCPYFYSQGLFERACRDLAQPGRKTPGCRLRCGVSGIRGTAGLLLPGNRRRILRLGGSGVSSGILAEAPGMWYAFFIRREIAAES